MKKLLIAFLLLPFTIQGQIISTVAGNSIIGYSGDGGMATLASLSNPTGVFVDHFNNVYIADMVGNRIRKVNSLGIITTVAGNGGGGYSGDGVAATATTLYWPAGVAVDSSGNLFIAEQYNHRIRKVNTLGIITTIAGNSTLGFSGDGGAATSAELSAPTGIVIDRHGNIFIADMGNNRIRKINSSGIITTVAGCCGTAGYSGDGGVATLAMLNTPEGVSVDSSGNIYIADVYNNRIRKVNNLGIITTIAGIGYTGFYGDGGAATAARLFYPRGVFVDNAGIVYVSDGGNGRIRKIDTAGIIKTIAGNGTTTYSGDGGMATAAGLYDPVCTFVDYTGNVYIADADNNRIRKVSCVLPPLNLITGLSNTCLGDTIILRDSTSGGVWSSSNSNATVSSMGVILGVSDGIDTIIYSISNRCGTAITKHVITINSIPVAGTITGTDSVCTGTTITLTDTSTGGVWSSRNSNATVTGGLVAGVSAGTDTISYTVTNSCGIASIAHIITVNSLPFAGAIIGIDSVCPGDTTTLTNTVAGGSWNSMDNAIAAISTTGLLTGVSSGMDSVWYVVTNTCGTDTASFPFTVSTCISEVKTINNPFTAYLTVYPDPNKGLFTINISTANNEDAQIIITNILGEKVKEITIPTNKETDVQLQAQAGIYFISAVTKSESTVNKIVIQ